jgi:hypothetical protein
MMMEDSTTERRRKVNTNINHRLGCRCAACAAIWEQRVAAMKEFMQEAGLIFTSPAATITLAEMARARIWEAFPPQAQQRLEALGRRRLDDLLSRILD